MRDARCALGETLIWNWWRPHLLIFLLLFISSLNSLIPPLLLKSQSEFSFIF